MNFILLFTSIFFSVFLSPQAQASEAFPESSPETSISADNQIVTARITSPDGNTSYTLNAQNGRLFYQIMHNENRVIDESRLGLRFLEQHGLDDDLRIVSVAKGERDETWEQPWGERQIVRDHHNELVVFIERKTPTLKFSIRIRAFNDGIGFRYEVPEQANLTDVSITDELTEFTIDQTATAWWIPARKWNRYEYLYQKTPVSTIDMVHTPVTLQLPTGVHISLHEAALVDYSGMSIERQRDGRLKANLAPRSDGILVKTKTPFVTPWRTIQIADEATGLLNSDLILNLNEPNKLGDVSWVEPGKYTGIWWQQHMRDRTWGRDGIHGATTEETIKFMDFAAKNGFVGVLVEGWNLGWDGDWYNNGDVFSFTDSYDDFDIEKISAYGRKLGVRLIGHHETSGNISNYENQLEAALDLYAANDVAVIKTGYVADGGNIKRIDEKGIARYEFHDGQHMVEHHLSVVKRAAEHNISINAHEPVKDTGLRRTYPNWISREGARGQEFNAWGVPPNGPDHVLNLLYTRMLAGPMDYTAGAFDLRPNERPPLREDMPRNDIRARIEHTLAKELSIYVVLYSPIQMVIDLPEHYDAHAEAFQFIKDVPTDWAHTIALDGAVGEFAVIARKDRNSADWYLGAMTDEMARSVDIDLSFLGGGQYQAQIYRDGADADYDLNPYDLVVENKTVTASDKLTFDLGRSGGAAVRFKKL